MKSDSVLGLLVVDACCWIDLFATGRIKHIIAALPFSLVVARYVAEEEVLTIRTESGREQRCNFAELCKAGLVAIWEVAAVEEKRELVRFSAHLDDGEAAVCALAVVHRCAVATDDRKTIRVLGRLAPELTVVQTPELLHSWAERIQPGDELLREILGAISSRARFMPRPDAPFAAWWMDNLKTGG